jgi:pimeloyl-ACP methyl ester carboxylesterase
VKWSIEHGMSVRRVGSPAGGRSGAQPADNVQEIVWIHGLGESSTSFLPIVEMLDGFAHTLVDLPGYGRSVWPDEPIGLLELADQLASWLPKSAVVIGHSMGGVLATMIGDRAAAIVNIDGNISRGDCTFSGKASAWSERDFVDHGLAELRARVYEDGLADPPLRGYAAAMTFASPRMFHRHARELVELSEAESLAARFAALTVPALFVAGVPRGICERSRNLLEEAGARWTGVEPAGHWVYLDQPARFASIVRELCTSALSSRR